MSDKLSILEDGRMSQNFEYTVTSEGKSIKVRESLDLDIQNGNYGKTNKVVYKSKKRPFNWVTVNPNSLIGEAITKDADGGRGNAFRSAVDDVSVLASKQTTRNERTHENALRESGMYDVARGFTSHSGTEFPDKTKNKDVSVKEEGKKEDTSPAPITKTPDKDPEVLRYPADLPTDQDYILIEAFEYTAPQADSLAKHGNVKVRNNAKGQGNQLVGPNQNRRGASTFKEKYMDLRDKKTQEQYGFANTTNAGLSRGSNIGNAKTSKGMVKLPIPNAIKSSNGVDWGEGRVNALEAGAFMGVQNQISSLLGGKTNIAGATKSGLDGIKETFNKLPELGGGQSGQLISSVLSKTALAQVGINVDPSQMIARSTGMAINPNLELLFSSPKLRTFTFVFQFAPDDEVDATATRKIQRFFKQGMLPSKSNNTSEKLYLGSPHVFRLCYKNKGKRIKGLNIFKICALTACEINFTPENVYQAYEDEKAVSMPVRSFMTLTFTELTPIFSNDYDHNFVSKNVDPSLADLGLNIVGENNITDDDIGF